MKPQMKSQALIAQCEGCPAGQFNSVGGILMGGNSQKYHNNKCAMCPAGKFSSHGSSECAKCKKGQYTGEQGSSSCAECLDGLFANNASTHCLPCPIGLQ